MKRRNLIILVIVVVLLLAVGVFFLLSRKTTPQTSGVPTFPQGSGAQAPGGGTGGAGGYGSVSNFVPGSGAPLPRLYQLHTTPVAGAGFYETGSGSSLSVSARYMERSLGNIFETPLNTFAETRISNETHPQVAEALWGNKGNSVIFRYLDSQTDGLIKSHIINLGTSATPITISTSTESVQPSFLKTEEVFLPDYIPFASTAGDNSNTLFYLKDTGGPILGFVTDFKNSSAINIFSSPFTEWLPQFPNKNLVTLNTKPSADVPGDMFFLNPKTKAVTKILGDINGLTTLTNTDGKYVLYSGTQVGVPQLSVYDTTKKTSNQISLQTLPEKCVWSTMQKTVVYCAVPQNIPTGTYPDQWYQGVISFSDSLWRIDVATLNVTPIMVPGAYGAPAMDMTNLLLSSNDAYLLFVDKITSTPWVYRLIDTPQTVSSSNTTTPTILPSAITPDMQKIR